MKFSFQKKYFLMILFLFHFQTYLSWFAHKTLKNFFKLLLSYVHSARGAMRTYARRARASARDCAEMLRRRRVRDPAQGEEPHRCLFEALCKALFPAPIFLYQFWCLLG